MVKKISKEQAQKMFSVAPKKDWFSYFLGKVLVWAFILCFIGLFAAGIKFSWVYLF